MTDEADDTTSTWQERFSLRIVEGIKAHRTAQGMKVQQLADKCSQLGYPMGRTTLANIEKGLRKSITVHEVVVFAAALGVPPIMLVCPDIPAGQVEIMPGETVDSWEAAKWFTGEWGTAERPMLNRPRTPWLLRALRNLDALNEARSSAQTKLGKAHYQAEGLRESGNDDAADLLIETAQTTVQTLDAERIRLLTDLKERGAVLGTTAKWNPHV